MRLHVNDYGSILGVIPDGQPGIEATLALMSRVVFEYKKNLQINELASDIIRFIPGKSYAQEARALFEWVRSNIRYQRDINGVEVIQSPTVTIASQHGDCDDMSILLAVLLETAGHPTKFVAAGFGGGDIEHVWVETLIGDRWFAMDPTEQQPFGWRPPGITSRLTVHN